MYKVNVNLTSDPLTPKIYWGHYLTKSNAFVKFEGQGSMDCRVIDCTLSWHTKSNVTITFEPLTPKSMRVISMPRPIHLCSFRAKGSWVVKLLIRNHFYLQGQYDLDLWPLNPKTNSGHILAKANAPLKFEGQSTMSCWDINWKPFWHSRSIWPCPLTLRHQKTIGVIF
jgi:hypothetical protein